MVAWTRSTEADRTTGGGVLAEYRLEELARVSGVSVRNIRAYRERGLLDPPRRDGRAALYALGALGYFLLTGKRWPVLFEVVFEPAPTG